MFAQSFKSYRALRMTLASVRVAPVVRASRRTDPCRPVTGSLVRPHSSDSAPRSSRGPRAVWVVVHPEAPAVSAARLAFRGRGYPAVWEATPQAGMAEPRGWLPIY